jgi:hypothetical protein
MSQLEIHVQLVKRPSITLPSVDICCQLKRKSVTLAREFRYYFGERTGMKDWNPYTVAFVCPNLMDARMPRVHDFIGFLEDLPKGTQWTVDSGRMIVMPINKRYARDTSNRMSGQSFSLLLSGPEADKEMTPVIFMTYRRVDIRDL